MSTQSEPTSTVVPSNGSDAPSRSYKITLLNILTKLQRLPTPFISLFLSIHLTAPIVASIGGSSVSSQVMLLGREYYQGTYTEPLLLFAPLGIHIASSLARRVLLKAPKKPSLVTVSAYPALILVPIHIMLHRIIPSDPNPPVSSLSPSELDFEFVKAGLSHWPILTWLAYGAMVGAVLIHGAEGAAVIARSWFGVSLPKRTRRLVALGAAGLVAAGLLTIAREPLLIRGARLERVLSIYRTIPIHT